MIRAMARRLFGRQVAGINLEAGAIPRHRGAVTHVRYRSFCFPEWPLSNVTGRSRRTACH